MGAQQRRPRRVAATLVHVAMAVWSLSLSVADLAHAVANGHAVGPGVMGQTFGNGMAGLDVCKGTGSGGKGPVDTVILNHTLGRGAGVSHGVLHHFWVTGDDGPGMIDEVWVSYFVDGEATPSIVFQPGAMCGAFFPALTNGSDPFLYSASSLCGRNSNVGGWFNSFPIPFAKSVVVTARPADTWAKAAGCLHSYWNVRGTENLPVVLPLSGIPLPPTARLRLQRTEWTLRQPLEYVDITRNAAGERGLVFMVGFGVEARPVGGTSVGGGYVEGCWQFYRSEAEPFPGLVVGTGLEDYFDSAFYFGADTGLQRGVRFANAMAGLPFFQRDGVTERISAYRMHATDPLAFVDGGRLVWRVGEGHQPEPDTRAPGTSKAAAARRPRIFTKCGNNYSTSTGVGRLGAGGREISPVNVSSYGWVYTWA